MNIFFWRKPKLVAPNPPIYGVNVGGWLVLEKWMTPSLFKGMPATDEYTFCQTATPEALKQLQKHRDTFITKADFVWLKQQGIQAVRLPVGYWAFGDEQPYAGTVDYIDKAFDWAEETGLTILLDMHGAPGSQNGWDHSGKSGECAWHTDESNAIKTLEVLKRLAERYGHRSCLLGIELLNEPKWTVPRNALLHYYEAAYKMIRETCGDKVWVVFSDNFRPRRWKRKLRAPEYTNVYIDTHQYQTFNQKDKRLDMAGHMHKTLRKVPSVLQRMAKNHEVIVGEWSIALDPLSLQGLNNTQVEGARRAYAGAQLIAYEPARAWFYWSYKTEDGGVWSFRDCVKRGWLPRIEHKK